MSLKFFNLCVYKITSMLHDLMPLSLLLVGNVRRRTCTICLHGLHELCNGLKCQRHLHAQSMLSVNIWLVYYRRYLFYLGSLSSRGNLGNQYVSSVSYHSFRIFLHGISLRLEGSTFECSALLLSWNCILHIDICFGNQMCSLRIVLPSSFLYLIRVILIDN